MRARRRRRSPTARGSGNAHELDGQVFRRDAHDCVPVAAGIREREMRRDLGITRRKHPTEVVRSLQLEARPNAVHHREIDRRLGRRGAGRLVHIHCYSSGMNPSACTYPKAGAERVTTEVTEKRMNRRGRRGRGGSLGVLRVLRSSMVLRLSLSCPLCICGKNRLVGR